MPEQETSPTSVATASVLSAAALRELGKQAEKALSSSRDLAARLEVDIANQFDHLSAALAAQVDTDCSAPLEIVTFEADKKSHLAEIERLTGELAKSQEAWREERKALEGDRQELATRAELLESRYRISQEEWRNQLLQFEARLQEQHASWNEQRAEWGTTRATLERQRDEIQQKFDLALQDVQRMRERVSELEADLARRPSVELADSAELVSLRAERDALLERVEQLESRPASPLDSEVEQQFSNLQRRFELAVEDVRELKTKNAQLESRLAENSKSRSAPSTPTDSGSMDWESQKRRLLAVLADEGEPIHEPERQQERCSIQDTIEMTDAIVAKKDLLIAELTAELEVARRAASNTAPQGGMSDELIETDEIIAQHRRRAQELEREMIEKLRSAELELSVERAKLAREKAHLEELRATLDSQRQHADPNAPAEAAGAPRRRWLSKLGIDGKD
ncbi:MAG: hypothetical protein IT425_03580 [Pirellulales bacterium]|nr:hypothetical protein [Pirellulales bacterium]